MNKIMKLATKSVNMDMSMVQQPGVHADADGLILLV